MGDHGNEVQRSNAMDRNREMKDFPAADRSKDESKPVEKDSGAENPPAASPRVTLNAPAEVLARTRVTIYGSITTDSTFNWAQISGPPVIFSGDNTLAPSFTAPAAPATLVFELTATNPDGASTTATSTINSVPDDVKVSLVTWTKPKGKGKLDVVATSSVITSDVSVPPDGMSMVATFWNKTIPDGLPGSSTKPIETPMTFVRNVPGQSSVCASAQPCFSAALTEGIVDPRSPPATPQFVPPTTVVIKSSLGGSGTAMGSDIHIR